MAVDEFVQEELKKRWGSTAVSLVTTVDGYIPTIKGVAAFAAGAGVPCIYLTSTIPAKVMLEQLVAEGVDASQIYFIDCISYMAGTDKENSGERTLFIESPTMLETIMLKVNLWLKRIKDEKKMVCIDSVNTLAMHNDEKLLSEFLHYIINNLRVKGIFTVVLSVEGQTPQELETILRLVCDDVVVVKGEGA